jgi:O-antigen/teichoic acid export membrane protein
MRGAQLAGLGWVASQGLLFATYLVLARLISPGDFGRYAAGTLITGFGGLFAEGGMMAALISRRDGLDEAANSAFFSLLISGVLLTAGGLAISPLFGLFFHSGEVARIEAVLSGWLFLKCVTVVPDALLQRRFSFLRRVAVEPLGALAFAGTGIALGASGLGAWALVAAAYASMFVQVTSAWLFAGFRPQLRLASVRVWRELSKIARPLVAAETIARGAAQLDGLLLGRFVGLSALGQYRNGFRLASQPGAAFVNVVSYVLLPAFARIAATPERMSAAVRRVYAIVIPVSLPVSFAALPLGAPVAVLLLGARWRPAGHAIAGLCGLVFGWTLIAIATEIFKVTGASRVLVKVQLFALCVTVVTVTIGALVWGLVGVAVAMSVNSCATGCYALYRVQPFVNLRLRELAAASVAPLIATAAMVAAMLGFGSAVDPLAHAHAIGFVLVAGEALVGAATYALILLTVDRSQRTNARQLAGRIGGMRWGRRREQAQDASVS